MLKVTVTGVEELRRNIRKLGDEFTRYLEAATVAGALIVQNAAKERAPYKTGTLRRSIHSEVASRKPERVEVLVGTDVPYARRIEYGFSGADKRGRRYNQPPRPYLRPALDENKQAVIDEIRDALKAVLGRVGR